MANMSYCRMRNTEQDLRDCINHLDPELRYDDEELSMEEEKAARRMIGMMIDFLNENDLMQVDIDAWSPISLNEEAIEELFRRGDSDQYSA